MTTKFTVHTKQTAPEASVELLQGTEKNLGFYSESDWHNG
jgi:hypothetical protein